MNINKSKPKRVIISTLDYYRKEKFLILILEAKVLTLATIKVDIAIIDMDTYCAIYKLKKA